MVLECLKQSQKKQMSFFARNRAQKDYKQKEFVHTWKFDVLNQQRNLMFWNSNKFVSCQILFQIFSLKILVQLGFCNLQNFLIFNKKGKDMSPVFKEQKKSTEFERKILGGNEKWNQHENKGNVWKDVFARTNFFRDMKLIEKSESYLFPVENIQMTK